MEDGGQWYEREALVWGQRILSEQSPLITLCLGKSGHWQGTPRDSCTWPTWPVSL